MADHDLLGTDQHFLHQEPNEALTFLQGGVLRCIVEPAQEALERFGQFEVLLPIHRAVFERVEFATDH